MHSAMKKEQEIIEVPMTRVEALAVMRVIGVGNTHTDDEQDRFNASSVAKRIVRLFNEKQA
jgi:hypothetical protein